MFQVSKGDRRDLGIRPGEDAGAARSEPSRSVRVPTCSPMRRRSAVSVSWSERIAPIWRFGGFTLALNLADKLGGDLRKVG